MGLFGEIERRDIFDEEKRSEIMRSIKSKDTAPEVKIKRLLSVPFVENDRENFNADICFREKKVAVFIDGDFWHGKNFDEKKERMSKKWKEHIAGNMRRDERNRDSLIKDGWIVLSFWESDVKRFAEDIAIKIQDAVLKRDLTATDVQEYLFKEI